MNLLFANGWESWFAFSGRSATVTSKSRLIRVGSFLDSSVHYAEYRLLERKGLASLCETKKLICNNDPIKPSCKPSMKILLQINILVNSRSTGRIAEEIGKVAINNGWESYIAFGRYERLSQSKLIRIGTDWDIKFHGIQTRLFDSHGLGSVNATKGLIKQIEQIQPSLIHLHNLHGYYLNIEILFNYLANANIPVIWTLHDCWATTGHCAHFELVGCDKWKTQCSHCPQKKEYPASYFVDRSYENFKLKKVLFTNIKNLTIVPVSKWLGSIVQESFLSKYPINIINNGIDLTIFHPDKDNFKIREKYQIGVAFMVLGVATAWSNDKGLKEFIELSTYPNWKVILIGIPETIRKKLPKNIIAIPSTENQNALAEFYATADVFINPTYQDSFPTVNLEAIACGTPVITYKTGGSPESLSKDTGIIIDKGDIRGIINAVEIVRRNGKNFYSKNCRDRALNFYNKNERYLDYLKLYESILLKTNLNKKQT